MFQDYKYIIGYKPANILDDLDRPSLWSVLGNMNVHLITMESGIKYQIRTVKSESSANHHSLENHFNTEIINKNSKLENLTNIIKKLTHSSIGWIFLLLLVNN